MFDTQGISSIDYRESPVKRGFAAYYVHCD